ncbi:DNA (cytosine-5)-methyltransferase 1, replication foci domain-containing protein [Cynara cardunculus var. scolymus]|uniref:DNA (Cytosine-5)-methyltransferase 1, replication foci domain-containing protein n=1 Tax=Cynara cardunculus var. scolymus TaxID=59895 RepID=A0A103YFB0_CYNCS|nr:DNA (cytosine-5)-methyltransferase 1, replication foci domain-containing protein [Cynara cardunculus var. scolymus]
MKTGRPNLAVQWSESESLDNNNSQICLRGTADNGLQKLYRPVKAWKCDISKAKPEISALSRDNNWIKLLKPRKCFEDLIRTILIIVYCLHFFKRKPEASGKSDIRPLENDLVDHLSFISEAMKRNKTLRKFEFLASLLEKKPRKRKDLDENTEVTMKPNFIVDDMNDECGDEELTIKAVKEYEFDDEDDGFETVCAICDDGGDLTCYEGKCLRPFHATIEYAEDHDVIFAQTALINNTSALFAGNWGLLINLLLQRVFAVVLQLVAIFITQSVLQRWFMRKVMLHHRNFKKKLLLVSHLHVMPTNAINVKRESMRSQIAFWNEDNDEDVIASVWNGLLPKARALQYFLKHKIDAELDTPLSNLKFLDIGHSKKQAVESLISKKEVADSDYTSKKGVGKFSSSVRPVDSSKKRVKMSYASEPMKRQRVTDNSKKLLQKNLSMIAGRPNA